MDTSNIADLAQEIVFHVGAWQDFGYENPPTPESATVPPLGERSANAIRAGHAAIDDIDKLVNQLYQVRQQLFDELRKDSDLRGARIDAMLASSPYRRQAPIPGRMGTGTVNDDDEESLAFADESDYIEDSEG